ncbi:MAG: RlpA-like double-psi beta-barrel domain-containing protein [Candidatus Moraniibacteriota bacterium]
MKRPSNTKSVILLFGTIGIGWVAFLFFHSDTSTKQTTKKPETFPITFILDQLTLPEQAHTGETVGEILKRVGISYTKGDDLIPSKETQLTTNMLVSLVSTKKYSIATKDGKREGKTTLRTVGQLLNEQGISLGKNDLVTPDTEKALTDNVHISVIQVDIRSEVIRKPIAFTVQESEDATLSWRKRLITQKGEKGIRELTYEVVSHDGKEIKRTLVESKITKEPLPEIATQGTKVEVGKKHTGLGSWYSFTGTLSAANPWLPIGSYVRVTNTENGKSVIVRINDRGPFGKNRIIDLDRVAFEKIASIGAGIIPVKVEEITN